MKLCPRCELNYMEDFESLCEVCYAAIEKSKRPKYDVELIKSHLVSAETIHNKISANAIFQSIRYLTYNYGEYSIYDIEHSLSYRNVLQKLQSRFYYAKEKYPSKAGFAYVFEAKTIWKQFFLADNDFRQTITHRGISSLSELISNAHYWHSLPVKTRKV